MTKPCIVKKSGVNLIAVGPMVHGQMPDPNKKPNPCGHFGATVLCTCPVRERCCKTCRRCWTKHGDCYVEIIDPHRQPAALFEVVFALAGFDGRPVLASEIDVGEDVSVIRDALRWLAAHSVVRMDGECDGEPMWRPRWSGTCPDRRSTPAIEW